MWVYILGSVSIFQLSPFLTQCAKARGSYSLLKDKFTWKNSVLFAKWESSTVPPQSYLYLFCQQLQPRLGLKPKLLLSVTHFHSSDLPTRSCGPLSGTTAKSLRAEVETLTLESLGHPEQAASCLCWVLLNNCSGFCTNKKPWSLVSKVTLTYVALHAAYEEMAFLRIKFIFPLWLYMFCQRS